MVQTLGRRGFAAAATLSLIAGYIDGFGYVFLGGYFVSFMTGNTTRAGVDLVGGALGAVALAALLIVAFVGGAVVGTIVTGRRMRSETAVLVLVTSLVALAAVGSLLDWRVATGVVLAAAMGAMNTVFARGGDVRFGITYMTGALVRLAQTIVAAVQTGQRGEWVRHFLMWASIASGAILGAFAFSQLRSLALILPTILLVIVLSVPRLRAWFRG